MGTGPLFVVLIYGLCHQEAEDREWEEERCLDPHHQPVGQIDNLFVKMLSSDSDTEPRSLCDTRRRVKNKGRRGEVASDSREWLNTGNSFNWIIRHRDKSSHNWFLFIGLSSPPPPFLQTLLCLLSETVAHLLICVAFFGSSCPVTGLDKEELLSRYSLRGPLSEWFLWKVNQWSLRLRSTSVGQRKCLINTLQTLSISLAIDPQSINCCSKSPSWRFLAVCRGWRLQTEYFDWKTHRILWLFLFSCVSMDGSGLMWITLTVGKPPDKENILLDFHL